MTATAKAAPRSAPVDIESIKDDLGICPGDSTHDAWLQRRLNGIWARFQAYTGRPLQLSSGWVDDWGKVITNAPAHTQPPILRSWPSGTVYLRVFPVQAITKLTLDEVDQDVARLMFDSDTGKLVGLDSRALDLRHLLMQGRARVEYTAGFDEIPGDLYEALLGAIQQQWAARQSMQAGLGAGGIRRISAIDVGDIEMAAATPFVEGTLKGAGAVSDPLLGPFLTYLDSYIDWRSMLGSPLPDTIALGTVPLPPGPTGGVSEAPMDGTPYVRQDGAWVPAPLSPEATDYDWSTNTAPPPNGGQVRASADGTALYFHKESAAGFDTTRAFPLVFTPGRVVLVQDRDDSTKWRQFDVTGAPVDAGTYWTLPVTQTGAGNALTSQRVVVLLK